jgi:hypothetical protein
MKNLKKFNELHQDVNSKIEGNKSHLDFLSDFINDLKRLYESIITTGVFGEKQSNFIEKLYEIDEVSSILEGKAFKASKNPYGSVTKEDKKDQLRKAVEDHIKDKECKTKKVGDDFEIHCDGEHIGQVMFRDEKITVKKQGEKFGKEFKYNELGKIKAEVTSVIKDCK